MPGRRVLFLSASLLLCAHVVAQTSKQRKIKSLSVREGGRQDRLEHYDRKGNLCFHYWDHETTAVRAMEYDSIGRMVKMTSAHCNVGCSEQTFTYQSDIKRTFELKFPSEDSTGFPREEAFSTILRKVHNTRALDALPEMVALRQLTPRLLKEEYFDPSGNVVRLVSYGSDGINAVMLFQFDSLGHMTKEISCDSKGDTTMIEYEYRVPCKEPVREHHTTNHEAYWAFGKSGRAAEVYRHCNAHGNTERMIMVDTTGAKVDTLRYVESRYSTENKLVMRSSTQYGELRPTESYEYDARGNVAKYISYSPGGPAHLTRAYSYDESDVITEETVTEFGHTKMLRFRFKYWD